MVVASVASRSSPAPRSGIIPGALCRSRNALVCDVAGELKSQAFLCTDLAADPLDILRWFVRRWSIEVTFAEVRRHLGVGHRQLD